MAVSREMAIYSLRRPDKLVGGKWVYVADTFDVRVIARAEGYAMVSLRGCAPFVCAEKDLSPPTKGEPQ